MFSRIANGVIAFFLMSGMAVAADLPMRKSPPAVVAAPMLTWTGFYVGANVGYSWSASSLVNLQTGTSQFCPDGPCNGSYLHAYGFALGATGQTSLGHSAFLGGGQVGYNHQLGSFVLGLEADIQGFAGASSSISRAALGLGPGGADNTVLRVSKGIDYLATIRGRAGFLATPQLLLYATGGLALGQVTSSTLGFQYYTGPTFGVVTSWSGAAAYSSTRVGWTLGAGGEWMFARNWSVKLEYLYYDLGSIAYAGIYGNQRAPGPDNYFTNVTRTSARFNGHVLRAGLNYHFDFGATPVVARY